MSSITPDDIAGSIRPSLVGVCWLADDFDGLVRLRVFGKVNEIPNFNNEFFTHVSSDFSYAEYENIYKSGNAQQINHRIGGQVTLNFIEGNTVDELTPLYLDEVVKTIETCVSNNFELGELCILVRRNSEGVAIAQRLQEENIPVISSESLLLKQSPQVQ